MGIYFIEFVYLFMIKRYKEKERISVMVRGERMKMECNGMEGKEGGGGVENIDGKVEEEIVGNEAVLI